MGNIYEKLAEVQKNLKAPKGQTNTFGKYKYRSAEDIIEAAKPLCIANGLLLNLTDEIVFVGARYYIKATAMVTEIESGTSLSVSAYARESEEKKGMDDSQITGTASSYARKYAMNGLFAIDDTKDADTDEYAKQTEKGKEKANKDVTDYKGKCLDILVNAGLDAKKVLATYEAKGYSMDKIYAIISKPDNLEQIKRHMNKEDK